jgi:plastocyanin
MRTGSASSPTHHVAVGMDGKMTFEPSFVKAVKGDTVRFRFFPSNHTVTSSDFDTPCKKNGDFDSGFKPTFVKNSTMFTDYQVKDDGKPSWFHR